MYPLSYHFHLISVYINVNWHTTSLSDCVPPLVVRVWIRPKMSTESVFCVDTTVSCISTDPCIYKYNVPSHLLGIRFPQSILFIVCMPNLLIHLINRKRIHNLFEWIKMKYFLLILLLLLLLSFPIDIHTSITSRMLLIFWIVQKNAAFEFVAILRAHCELPKMMG